MSTRAFHDEEWFRLRDPKSLYEIDFQNIVARMRNELFETYHLSKLNIPVSSREFRIGRKVPDFVLIDHLYRDWWVVEVELSTHDYSNHVEPQIQVLSTGDYGEEHAHSICRNNVDIDFSRLRDLIRMSQPMALLVCDDIPRSWESGLSDFCRFMKVNLYQNRLGESIFFCSGSLNARRKIAIELEYNQLMPKGFFLDNPHFLGLSDSSVASIESYSGISEWKFSILGNKGLLNAMGEFPFSKIESKSMSIEVFPDGALRFARTTKQRSDK